MVIFKKPIIVILTNFNLRPHCPLFAPFLPCFCLLYADIARRLEKSKNKFHQIISGFPQDCLKELQTKYAWDTKSDIAGPSFKLIMC